MDNIQILVTMLVSLITLVLTVIKMITDQRNFNKKNHIEISSKTELQRANDIRSATANLVKDYKTLQSVTELSNNQDEKEKAHNNFVYDISLLRLYFSTGNTTGDSSLLNLAGECQVDYYTKPSSMSSEEITENQDKRNNQEQVSAKNKSVIESLKDSTSNKNKDSLINELLEQFGDMVSQLPPKTQDTDKDKTLDSVRRGATQDGITDYFNQIIDIISIYLRVEEEEAKKGE